MKSKEKTQLSGADLAELVKTLAETEKKLATIVGSKFTKQITNTREVRNLRRKIAVVKTYMRQKELVHE